MELYNAQTMPLSNDSRLRAVQEKIIKGESLTISEKMIAGRDHPVKELAGYHLKPDHAYRAISEELYELYKKEGFIYGTNPNDEYQEYEENGKIFNNNRGVDWYLGGVSLKYGEIILECPADKEYFTPAYDNGSGMSFDPTVRFLKSSGAKKPIPITMLTNVFDARKIKEQQAKQDTENFMKMRELDQQRMMQLRYQQLETLSIETQTEQLSSGGISK